MADDALSESDRADAAGAILTVDLGAIVANYRILRQHLAGAECGAVLKADAYGLGARRVGPALFDAGCRRFFTAHLDEAIALRAHLPEAAAIYVMHGVFAGREAECLARALVPVLNSQAQLDRWAALARQLQRRLPAVIQLDSGMARFGFAEAALEAAAAGLGDLRLAFVMSHLACADTPDDPANTAQLGRFAALRARLPPAPGSLVASSGIFLPPEFHLDLARPGAALFGVAPQPGCRFGLRPVVRLAAKVVQLRDVSAGTPVGYGHSARTAGPARLATIAAGYADGYLRSGSNRGAAWFDGTALPVVGRISMDSMVLDASALPDGALREGSLVELIGAHRDVDAVAHDAGTIGYEVLTSLGRRYHRRYVAAAELVGEMA